MSDDMDRDIAEALTKLGVAEKSLLFHRRQCHSVSGTDGAKKEVTEHPRNLTGISPPDTTCQGDSYSRLATVELSGS